MIKKHAEDYFGDRKLGHSEEIIHHILTIDELRLFSSYTHYFVKSQKIKE